MNFLTKKLLFFIRKQNILKLYKILSKGIFCRINESNYEIRYSNFVKVIQCFENLKTFNETFC
jgi:hypothetical protein